MADGLSSKQIQTLKSRFAAAGCTVRDLVEFTFEVYANPYLLELGTQILAKPKEKFSLEKVRELLCSVNRKASLVKFTMDKDKPDQETQAWPILASTKLVTGVVGGDYPVLAIKNLLLLWPQDITVLMAEPPDGFEVHPMLDIEKLSDT